MIIGCGLLYVSIVYTVICKRAHAISKAKIAVMPSTIDHDVELPKTSISKERSLASGIQDSQKEQDSIGKLIDPKVLTIEDQMGSERDQLIGKTNFLQIRPTSIVSEINMHGGQPGPLDKHAPNQRTVSAHTRVKGNHATANDMVTAQGPNSSRGDNDPFDHNQHQGLLPTINAKRTFEIGSIIEDLPDFDEATVAIEGDSLQREKDNNSE